MSSRNRTIVYLVYLFLGIGLLTAGTLEYVDEFWSGMGGALAAIGALKLVLAIRYRNDPEYAKQVEISNHDERNRFLSNKAKAWTLYLSIMILCALGLILRIAGFILESQMCFFIVCGMLVIYWVAYLIIRRKY